jgi:hypothetical protein
MRRPDSKPGEGLGGVLGGGYTCSCSIWGADHLARVPRPNTTCPPPTTYVRRCKAFISSLLIVVDESNLLNWRRIFILSESSNLTAVAAFKRPKTGQIERLKNVT